MFGYEQIIENFGLCAPDVKDYRRLKAEEKTRWVDGEGYQYYLSRQNLQSTHQKGGKISRFFNGNKYTESNVSLYASIISDGDISILKFDARNAHDKIVFYSRKYELEYSKSFNEFCHRCYPERKRSDYINKKRNSIAYIKAAALERFNISIESDNYLNNTSPLQFRCNKDGHNAVLQSMTWAQMITSDEPCRLCRKTKQEGRSRILAKDKFDSNLNSSKTINPCIEVIGEYTSARSKILCKCKKCGSVIKLRPDHILRGIGCGKCTKSLGESLIKYYLVNNYIDHHTQYKFEDCKIGKKPLPFDFFLPEYNIAIEFDGMQHYAPSELFGGPEEFRKLKLRDNCKSDYCASRGIKLIRIPFTELKNISSILDQQLLLKCS